MRYCKNVLKIIFPLVMMLLLFFLPANDTAYGASSVTIDTVDYKEENIIVNNKGNSRIYFATENEAARNSWEVIPADDNEDDTTSIDFLGCRLQAIRLLL